jgi:hypothetical protein
LFCVACQSAISLSETLFFDKLTVNFLFLLAAVNNLSVASLEKSFQDKSNFSKYVDLHGLLVPVLQFAP